jgi:hypothetical protein
MENNQARIKEMIWDMKTVEAAKMARLPALAFSIFGSFVWAVISIASLFGHQSIYGNWAYLSLVIFVVISYGLLRMRREAAISCLLVSIVGVGFAWGHTGKLIGEIAGAFVALLSVRGTFSYAHIFSEKRAKNHVQQ